MTVLWHNYTRIMIQLQETFWAKFYQKTVNWHNSDTYIPLQKSIYLSKICQKTVNFISFRTKLWQIFECDRFLTDVWHNSDSFLTDFCNLQLYDKFLTYIRWYKCVRIMSIDSFLTEFCSEYFLKMYHDACKKVS